MPIKFLKLDFPVYHLQKWFYEVYSTINVKNTAIVSYQNRNNILQFYFIYV